MDKLKTWDDVVSAARNSPVLRRVVELVRPDRLSREEALIQGVLALQQMLDESTKREIRLMQMQPPAPIIIEGVTLVPEPPGRGGG